MAPQKRTWLIHGGCFVATFITATLAGGPLYALTIMIILLAHELGHYLMCRKYRVDATFPLFIPMPNILGTMGAVIKMKSSIPNRKALFDIGIAGPLAGLSLAIPALIIGLTFSEVKTTPQEGVGLFLGEPLLFTWLSQWLLGPIPTDQLMLHPVGFAGWAVLFVTAINLLPSGQLDGGHIIFAMFGRHARFFSWVTALTLGYLGYKYQPMWYIFMTLILLFLIHHPAPVDDKTILDYKRYLLGIFAFVLLVLCFVPIPFEFRSAPITS